MGGDWIFCYANHWKNVFSLKVFLELFDLLNVLESFSRGAGRKGKEGEGLGKRGKQSFAKKVEQDLASLTSSQIKKEMRKPLLKQNWK